MYGAILGDLFGSIYEYDEFQDSSNNIVNLERRRNALTSNLINNNCFYSDDTILTMAILDSIINNIPYSVNLKKYGIQNKSNIPKDIPYFKYMFSPGFMKWCSNNDTGMSIGNGCMMRVSPIGYLFNTKEDILRESTIATIPSHNTELSIKSTNIVSLIIYYLRKGIRKDKLFKIIEDEYKISLNYSLENLQKENKFDGTCNVLEKLLYILKISDDFESAIRYTLSIGGDTDTNACIVGSMAEAIYPIPKTYIEFANTKLPKDYINLLNQGYSKIKKYKI